MKHVQSETYAKALTIATSDSSGGAGIQADLKAFSAMGCYGMSVLAALTAQNTKEVTGIHALPSDFVALQLDAVVNDLGVDAVKIGMLFNSKIMEAVAERLEAYRIVNIVLDPVMVAKSGAKLIKDDAVEALKTYLFPLSSLITPNLPEAEILLGIEIKEKAEMAEAAEKLLELGPGAVLLKGGHFTTGQSTDCLVTRKSDIDGRNLYWYEADRINTYNTHGTGCTLSSAITAGLAKGQNLPAAVEDAKEYVSGAIEAGSHYEIGEGHGPLHHFHQWWK